MQGNNNSSGPTVAPRFAFSPALCVTIDGDIIGVIRKWFTTVGVTRALVSVTKSIGLDTYLFATMRYMYIAVIKRAVIPFRIFERGGALILAPNMGIEAYFYARNFANSIHRPNS